MVKEKSLAKEEKCLFGIKGRFCQHQETRTRNIISAIGGDLVFICKLSSWNNLAGDCPMYKEALE